MLCCEDSIAIAYDLVAHVLAAVETNGPMPQLSQEEFERVPLRVHRFLEGVPLHDAWVVDLPRVRAGVTLDEFVRLAQGRLFEPSPTVRALLRLRFFVGRLFRWDPAAAEDEPDDGPTFAERLSPADRERSLAPAGSSDGPFRLLYRFPNEQLSEIVNRTVHAAALSALVEKENSYRFYFAVYVRSVGPLTPLYMKAIDPFRKLIVYPSLLRSVQTRWKRVLSDTNSGDGRFRE